MGTATLPVRDKTDVFVLLFSAPAIDARMQMIANASDRFAIFRGMAE